MSSSKKKDKQSKNSEPSINEEIKINDEQNNIKFIIRTVENNTHEVLSDIKLKNITSWRKSQEKFLKNLIFNIISLGVLHIISLFYPNLYLKLYCNPWPPKECDFFLVENIYGELTLCTKIYKKDKTNVERYSDASNENTVTSSIANSSNKIRYYFSRNLTYSFKYKSVTYEYNEETNEIIPVYMNLSNMKKKAIFSYFSEGLSSEKLVKKYEERYGKNEYRINFFIIHLYFRKIEMKCFIFIIITKSFDLLNRDYLSFILSIGLIISILIIEFFFVKKMVYELYNKEYTLDGEKNKIRVRRNNRNDNNSNSKIFYEIKNSDLLPGDIVYLKSDDLVPCDCLILEGDCIVNENNLNGSLNIFKKTSLENSNELFSYKLNKINILYHGMKIVKTFSKLKEGFISVLCINTGANTFKANLFSNILYLLDRKKEYNDSYKLLGEGRKKFFIIMIIIFLFCIAFGILAMFTVNVSIEIDNLRSLVLQTISKLISKGFMPSYFFTKSIIILLSLFNLKNEKILCFEKSKILSSSTINTIFFGKTGTLCENKFEINGYHPLYINPHNSNYITYKTYKASQYKDLNSQLVRFYRNYLNKNNINQESNMRHCIKKELNQLNFEKMNKDIYEYSALFLECLLSCNNLEKYNIEIIGNPIEKQIFENMKWDIKTYNFSSNSQDKELLEEDNSYFYQISNNKFSYDYINSNLIDKRINDIYPNNYYKITETLKNQFDLRNSNNFLNKRNISNTSDYDDYADFVKKNISKNNIKSYKLRIYKRFTKNGTLDSSAIVYNFITRELRFMTKGIPEIILDKCNQYSLPENFDRIISYYRKNGLIVIICASKLIDIEEYKDSNSIDVYMKDLNFCGFITLKNELKKEIINSIKDLKQFNCNCIISTGDNVYNSLSVGFESGIIDNKNKNIFSFDKDDKQNKITISKIYNVNKDYSDELEIQRLNSFIDKCPKKNSRKVNNMVSSPNTIAKESVILKSNDSTNYSLLTRKQTFKKKEFLLNPSNQSMNTNNQKEYSKNSSYEHYLLKRNTRKNHRTSKNGINFFNKKISQNIYESNMEYSEVDDLKSNMKNKPKYNYNNKGGDIRRSSIDKKSKNTYKINRISSNLEKYDYYPDIFKDIEEMANNCIYCISGKVFKFLYKNKEKKQYKKTLDLILKNCKIFYDMSSLDKSLAIDFFRESPKNRICYIGECQSDYDAIMTSNIGISLKPPKNLNTIFCHFYSEDSNILSIKKIIREGRAITENIMLLRMSSVFFTIIINSYVMCCLIRHVRIIDGQLILLEISFFILAISAFSAKYDTFSQSNCLIQNEKLYKRHYYIQIIGILLIKFYGVYRTTKFYKGNDYKLEERTNDLIYCCFYFIFCVEQLMSTIFVCNLICFYRKSPFTNIFFVILNIVLLLYFIILVTLSSSNYRCDIFNITVFEQLEELVDSFDDQNKLNCFWLCIIDLVASIFYSKLVFYIFNKLAQRSSE